MNTLQTPNLSLSYDTSSPGGGIADMAVTGKMKSDTLSESFEFFDQLNESGDDFALLVEMKADAFEDLSEVAGGFRQVADVLRRVPSVDKCVVLTDSTWLRNTVKVESAVIPGLKIMVFDPSERDNALRWLRDEPLVTPEPEAETEEEDKPDNPWANLDLAAVDH